MDATRFTAIDISDELYKGFKSEDEESTALKNLSQINIFIGANNSGKSRFLRKIFTDEEIRFKTDVLDIEAIDTLLDNFKREFDKARKSKSGDSFIRESSEVTRIPAFRWNRKLTDIVPLKNFFTNFFNTYSAANLHSFSALTAFTVAQKYQDMFVALSGDYYGQLIEWKFSNIYIPTLRGLRPIQITSSDKKSFHREDNYYHRTMYDYFKDHKKLRIFTGLEFYDDLDNYTRGGIAEREKKEAFEKFLSDTFFNGERVALTARKNDDVVYVRIGNTEHPVFSLGDGIQTIIILTYPLFFNQGQPLKIFYDEPELHMHPGYQRIFLETLSRPEFKSFQYFLTTHSNHLLDMTLDASDISVYTFQRINNSEGEREFLISNVENSNVNILSFLGVRNSSVFLSNCTIWVEGISDRIYMRKYLDIIQAEEKMKFKEDTHFSFVEYSGNNITHWSFLENEDEMHANIVVERLCGKVFLIADRDEGEPKASPGKKGTKKSRRHQQLQATLGDRYFSLPVREVENLLTPKVLAAIINENSETKIVDEKQLNVKAYKNSYLGKYIEDTIPNLPRKYASASGTLSNKVDFAKKAVTHIQTRADMSAEAIKLAEAAYKFIRSQNT